MLDLAVKLALRAGKVPRDIKLGIATQRNALGGDIHGAVVERAKQLGIPIVMDAELPDPIDTVLPMLGQVTTTKPDLLLVSGYAQGAMVTVRQMAPDQNLCSDAGRHPLRRR